MRTIGEIVKKMKWVMGTNESAETKGKCHHGKCQGCSLRLTGTRGLVGEGGVEGVKNTFGS